MREKVLEKKLMDAVKTRTGICPKFVSPGLDGMPDRIVLLPARKWAFVELKAPGEKARKLQIARHLLLRKLGYSFYVLDAVAQIGVILDAIQAS